MTYRFRILSDEIASMKMEIQISSEATFLQLRNAILDAAGFDRSHPDLFFLCDDDWERREPVAMTDDLYDTDEDVWLMDETPLENLVDEEGQKLHFVFDTDRDRFLLLEMREMLFDRTLNDPVCTIRQGRMPAQVVKDPEPAPKSAKTPPPMVEDLGLEFYGSDQYDAEDLPEGFDDEM